MSLNWFPVGLAILWLLACLRIWLMLSNHNVWQRRMIAIAAGLGAALIYQVSGVLFRIIEPQGPITTPRASGEDVRIRLGQQK